MAEASGAICGPGQGVVLVDDDPDIARWLHRLLAAQGVPLRWVPSAEALLASWPASDPAIRRLRREVVLLDLELPGMSGLEFLERYVPAPIDTPVLVFSGRADVGGAVRAMKLGAADLIQKPPAVPELMAALRQAFRADAAAAANRAEAQELRAGLMSLTSRERELLSELARGRTNAEVAARHGISARTVEVHRKRALDKTRSDSLTDLVHRVFRLGLGPLLDGPEGDEPGRGSEGGGGGSGSTPLAPRVVG